jgi:hypothetical protein
VVVVIPSSSSSSSSAMDVLPREKEDEEKQPRSTEQIPLTNPTSLLSSSHLSSSSSPSTVILRDHAEVIRTRRQCHSSISLLQHQQRQQHSASSAFDEPFSDCKQLLSSEKFHTHSPMSSIKISTCTMTGKSLNNLDDCLSSTSSEEKAVQTTAQEPSQNHSSIKRAMSITSLSSSSAVSIQTDSQEKKSKLPLSTGFTDTDHPTISQHPTPITYKWPHLHERLLGEQTCTYWVNYLGRFDRLLA